MYLGRVKLAATMLLAALAAAADRPSSWLEGTSVANWNKAGAELPKAPAAPSPDPRCLEQARPAVSRDDRAVVAAGWTLVGAAQVFGKTRAFLATAGYDGMCRPHEYQAFVYVEGRLAGTLSPQPMRARSDGALLNLRLTSEAALTGEFARYLQQDPLCCPSRMSHVSYKVESGEAGPLLVPDLLRVDAAPAKP